MNEESEKLEVVDQPEVEEVPEPKAKLTEDKPVEQPVGEKLELVKVEEKEKKQVKKKKEKKGFTLRSTETGDKVFLIRENKRHWVMNPLTLTKLGFNLGSEKTVSYGELAKYPEGKPLDLTAVKLNQPQAPSSSENEEESGVPYNIYS